MILAKQQLMIRRNYTKPFDGFKIESYSKLLL